MVPKIQPKINVFKSEMPFIGSQEGAYHALVRELCAWFDKFSHPFITTVPLCSFALTFDTIDCVTSLPVKGYGNGLDPREPCVLRIMIYLGQSDGADTFSPVLHSELLRFRVLPFCRPRSDLFPENREDSP